jgi:hypothetical protein
LSQVTALMSEPLRIVIRLQHWRVGASRCACTRHHRAHGQPEGADLSADAVSCVGPKGNADRRGTANPSCPEQKQGINSRYSLHIQHSTSCTSMSAAIKTPPPPRALSRDSQSTRAAERGRADA